LSEKIKMFEKVEQSLLKSSTKGDEMKKTLQDFSNFIKEEEF